MSTPTWRRLSKTTGIAAVTAAVALTAACGSGDSTESSGYTGAIGPVDLSQNCPAKIVVQTDWNPEAEHGHLYELLGAIRASTPAASVWWDRCSTAASTPASTSRSVPADRRSASSR